MIWFSKYLQRVKSTHKPTYCNGTVKKFNDKNLTDQLNCSYFTLFIVTNLELSKNVAI